MKPPAFDYFAPESLDEALALMAQHAGAAKPLAGGQSLVPAMNFRVAQPEILVDLNRLPGLDFVRAVNGDVHIGAMTRQRRIEHDPLIAQRLPLLHETIPHIAHPQIRNRGTIGGSLAHADPAAELPAIAVALDARLRAQSATGERWLTAHEFFLSMFTTGLAPDELLVEIAAPALPPRTGSSFVEFARRHGDYAIMGVAALITLDEELRCQRARLIYLNAGDGPVDAGRAAEVLRGHAHSAQAVDAAVAAADAEINPVGNVHASVAYQRHLAGALTRRALAQAFDRASQDN